MRSKVFAFFDYISGLTCLLITFLVVLDIAFNFGQKSHIFITIIDGIFFYFIFETLIRFIIHRSFKKFISRPTDLIVFLPLITDYIPTIQFFPKSFIAQLALLIIFLGRFSHISLVFSKIRLSPMQMVLLGFIYPILIGGLILSMPISSNSVGHVSFIDALFTATSAMCVTGLTTLDISQTYTLFGQTIILGLIQFGGLGIMAFSLIFALAVHKKFSQKESHNFQSIFNSSNFDESVQIFKLLFKFTLIFEALGAILLYFAWPVSFDSHGSRIYYSIFHSISAFCNAGFSLFTDSFTSFSTNVPIILTLAILIIFGGLGFPVLYDILHPRFNTFKFKHLRLQTKLALVVSGSLIIFGTLFILISEYNSALIAYNIFDKTLVSFFLSVSSRTAGFNSIATASLQQSTLLILIVLMFVGASPGSTGGGLKSTTFGILIVTFWNQMTGNPKNHLFGRKISTKNSLRSVTILVLSCSVIIFFSFLLLESENITFVQGLFETVSAFATVGLSLDVTQNLSFGGKLTVILLMFIGRVGPLTFAFALTNKKTQIERFDYPEENILTA
ncbi:hypothetical protein HOH45_07595 [bacterium]|nr:hypothetical protein [bacterium]